MRLRTFKREGNKVFPIDLVNLAEKVPFGFGGGMELLDVTDAIEAVDGKSAMELCAGCR